MSSPSMRRRRTCKPLIFNDPLTGKEFEIAAGETFVMVQSLKDASAVGFLNEKDESAVWAARTNLQRGYVLLWIRGSLRGVHPDSLEPDLQASPLADGAHVSAG
jgi:hypothetical protein